MVLEEEFYSFTFLKFLAETGGFMGIFLGLSLCDLIGLAISLISKVSFLGNFIILPNFGYTIYVWRNYSSEKKFLTVNVYIIYI